MFPLVEWVPLHPAPVYSIIVCVPDPVPAACGASFPQCPSRTLSDTPLRCGGVQERGDVRSPDPNRILLPGVRRCFGWSFDPETRRRDSWSSTHP